MIKNKGLILTSS